MVSLKVSLINHIHSVPIAEFIQIRVIRIVAGPDRVEVVLLHKSDISLHIFSGDCLSGILIMVVPVDSVEFHRDSVDKKLLTVDAYVTESHPAAACLDKVLTIP